MLQNVTRKKNVYPQWFRRGEVRRECQTTELVMEYVFNSVKGWEIYCKYVRNKEYRAPFVFRELSADCYFPHQGRECL